MKPANFYLINELFIEPMINGAILTHDQWGDIMVLEKKDYRILAFDPIYEQSCINIKLPHIPVHEYTRIMLFALAFVRPEKITLLGLGGGCLLNTLNFLLPKCSFYAIELRETVINVAKEYFALPIGTHVKIWHSCQNQGCGCAFGITIL